MQEVSGRKESIQSASFQGISWGSPTGSTEISPEGLVLAYDMRTITAKGDVQDFSGRGNAGRLFGTASSAGPFGSARRFGSPGDYVRLPARRSLHLRGPLSIAAWVRFSHLGEHQHMVAYDDLYTLWITEGNRIRFSDTQGDAFESVQGVVREGAWHSLVATFRGRPGDALGGHNIALCVDGHPVPGRAIGAWSPGRPVEGFVAKESHEGQFYLPFRGEIAALLMFRRALSVSEAEAFANVPHEVGGLAGEGRGPAPLTDVTPRVVRITNMIPPYRLRQHEILRDFPRAVFETWLMTDAERSRKWQAPADTTVRVFRDWGLDLSHRDLFAIHFNPGMSRELARRPPSLVLLGGYEQPTCVFLGHLLDRMRIPFLVNSESVRLADSVAGRRARFLVRSLVRRSAGVIASGRASRELFLGMGVPPERIFLAPPSVDVDRFTPAHSSEEKQELRERLGLPDGTVCLCVGRLVEWKGVLDLLEAFRLLKPKEEGLHLRFVGEGPLRPFLEQQVEGDAVLRGAVSLAGYVSEDRLPDCYRAADVFAFPTHHDVWGLVLNEAMSAGLPVVSSDGAAGALDLIEEGVSGLVVPRGHPQKFAAALLSLHRDPGLRARMGRAARERILDGFTPWHQAAAILRAVSVTLARFGRTDGGFDPIEGAWSHDA